MSTEVAKEQIPHEESLPLVGTKKSQSPITKRPLTTCIACLVLLFVVSCVVAGVVTLTVLLLKQPSESPPAPENCNTSCNLQIVESIPENLTYPNSSVSSHLSTYKSWMTLLESAKHSVSIASYYWTLNGRGKVSDNETDGQGKDVYDAIVAASKRGVRIRVVQATPNSEYPNIDSAALFAMGAIELRNLSMEDLVGGGILHTKLWIVDDDHFYVGSANMDWRSLTQVKELGLFGFNCSCLAADAQKMFEVYWDVANPPSSIPKAWPENYTASFNSTRPASVPVTNQTTAEVYWASSPPELCTTDRTGDLTAVLDVIKSARKFIHIAVMDYDPALIYEYPKQYWATIDDALRTAMYDRDIDVKLLGSYWTHTPEYQVLFMRSLAAINGTSKGSMETKFFEVPKLTNKSIPYTRVNHNKYMVTDNAAYIGTSNWSGDYFVYTGGVSIIVNQTEQLSSSSHNSTIQQQLAEVFLRDWTSSYSHSLYEILSRYPDQQ